MAKKRSILGSNINDITEAQLLNDLKMHITKMGGVDNIDPQIRGIVCDTVEGKKGGDWMDIFKSLMAFVRDTGKETSYIHLSGDQTSAGKIHPDLLTGSGRGLEAPRTINSTGLNKGF
jgi:hypothetical protein